MKTLSTKLGNCCDQAHLLIALLRASGIRAGYAHAQCYFYTSKKVIGHVWCKIYLNNTWVDADPTSNSNTIGHTSSNEIRTWNQKLLSELPF